MAYVFKHNDRPLDDYTIQRAVGCGGFGEVYYAISDGGREVALKYLKSNPAIELRGVSHCINLKSPHLVSIFDVKQNADGEYFIIMEYCSGPSLRDLMVAEPEGFGPQKSAFFVREIAKGLAYLHDRGIVHRDMKPGNIFYDDGYVKIGDYGLSKFISVSRHSAQTASVGTVHYMAPEIGSGNYSAGVDIYALGVMLYEMLLGRVPFEGSSMGEILMKHLTAQPELDELPHPFGEVIRKALQKDPKDRYQSANEMIEALLNVEEVRQSLAGFSTKSLQGAIQHGAAHGASSPIPSPNPPPRGGQAYGPPPPPAKPRPKKQRRFRRSTAGVMSERVARQQDRIARKIDKKLAKLSGGRLPKHQTQAYAAASRRAGEAPGEFVARRARRKRIVLCLLASAAIAIGAGFVFGNEVEAPYGIATGMLIVAMSGGIGLSRKAVRWFAAEDGPRWTSAAIRIGSCTPLLFVAAIPMLADKWTYEGLAIITAMLMVVILGNWNKPFERGHAGELSIGTAFYTGLGGLIAGMFSCGIFDGKEIVMMTSAVIAASVSLIIQMNSWWTGSQRPAFAAGSNQDAPASNKSHTKAEDSGILIAGMMIGGGSGATTSSPLHQSNHETADPYAYLRRWGITRAMWGLLAFCSACGVLAISLVMGLNPDYDPHRLTHTYYDDVTGMIIGLIACAMFTLFAARKTTPLRKEGFWRETLRPGMLTILTFGIGALITGIARNWDLPSMNDEARIGLVFGLVVVSLVWLGLLLFTGRKPRPQPAFVQPDVAMSHDSSPYTENYNDAATPQTQMNPEQANPRT